MGVVNKNIILLFFTFAAINGCERPNNHSSIQSDVEEQVVQDISTIDIQIQNSDSSIIDEIYEQDSPSISEIENVISTSINDCKFEGMAKYFLEIDTLTIETTNKFITYYFELNKCPTAVEYTQSLNELTFKYLITSPLILYEQAVRLDSANIINEQMIQFIEEPIHDGIDLQRVVFLTEELISSGYSNSLMDSVLAILNR